MVQRDGFSGHGAPISAMVAVHIFACVEEFCPEDFHRPAQHPMLLPSPPLSLLTSAAGRPQTGFTYADIPLMDETGEL